MPRLALVAALVAALSPAAAVQLSDVITAYGLTESYVFSYPDAPLGAKASDNWILDKWSVNSHISFGENDMYVVAMNDVALTHRTFVADPIVNATRIPVRDLPSPGDAAPAAATSLASLKEERAPQAAGDAPVLRIEYPKGSYSAGTGGTQFYAQPLNATSKSQNIFPNTTSNGQFERMLLSYDIYFDPGYM